MVALSFGLTSVLGVAGFFLFRMWAIRAARQEEEALIQDARQQLEMVELELQEKTRELEQEIFGPHEKELAQLEENIEDREQQLTLEEARLDQVRKELQAHLTQLQNKVGSYEEKFLAFQDQVTQLRLRKVNLSQQFRKELVQKLHVRVEELLERLAESELQYWQNYYSRWVRSQELMYQDQAEVRAKNYLARSLIRFHRPYCAERGIPYVTFTEDELQEMRSKFSDSVLEQISQIVGCDLIFSIERQMIIVGGYDPVRREFARRLLERCRREKNLEERLHLLATQVKKELLQNIKRDGDLLAKELGLKNLHVEIRKMMGSLRYRYSFTQNQYFHCAEVGWLAGLMASELKLDSLVARRAGMLHDLGKAMDHEFEGGHAVIGANFIEKYGESADVVHAVRAHHYDETPSTPLAFLVIAADAVSGGRPGARRSTVESFTQKVTDLQNIAYSFPEVRDCIVLNGGRECRVTVDSQKTTDRDALLLARAIAQKIEAECSYPGQIKVVVMRQTWVHETKNLSKASPK
ncbi:MAG: HDIG domain-containing protein [Pseudobdellovibrionaceae bacterium]|nr:HDIG domain-containing protein [Pseudobdellovibrionaceae bacterium]